MRGWIAAWKALMYISARARLHDGSNARHDRFSSLGPTAELASLSLVIARSVMCQVNGMFSIETCASQCQGNDAECFCHGSDTEYRLHLRHDPLDVAYSRLGWADVGGR